jgi:glycolate oxidase subunit GlcD
VHGLFYPPDPSSQGVSTIGGNIACNAGGPRCLKYGVTADYVVGLTAVLADGRILRVGDGITAQSPDAGLLQLLIGSEGTLAVITEVTLRLIPQPAARRTAMAIFDELDAACATVEAIMASGLLPAGLELMDDTTIAVVEDYLHLGLPHDAGALLLLLSDGAPEAVADEAAALAELARRGGARTVQVAQTAADEAALWQARRAISPALNRLRPNRLGEDICVPLPQIANAVRRIKQIAAGHDLPIAIFGHAGDGNLHPNILFDARDPAQVTRTWQAAEEIFRLALELGGTLSGEHGIGTLKRPFLPAALGVELLELQQQLKAIFDPQGRLNPGKLLP